MDDQTEPVVIPSWAAWRDARVAKWFAEYEGDFTKKQIRSWADGWGAAWATEVCRVMQRHGVRPTAAWCRRAPFFVLVWIEHEVGRDVLPPAVFVGRTPQDIPLQ